VQVVAVSANPTPEATGPQSSASGGRLDGRLISPLHRGTLPPGIHRLHWDCSGNPSGVYICRVNVWNEATAAGVIVVH